MRVPGYSHAFDAAMSRFPACSYSYQLPFDMLNICMVSSGRTVMDPADVGWRRTETSNLAARMKTITRLARWSKDAAAWWYSPIARRPNTLRMHKFVQVLYMPPLSAHVLVDNSKSMTMFLHPFLESIARLLQRSGGYTEVQFVPSLLNTTHSFSMLLFRTAVRVCGAESCLKRVEVCFGDSNRNGIRAALVWATLWSSGV